MAFIHHINAGLLHAPPGPRASCHCLLIEGDEGLVLVDTGIGRLDCSHADERLGADLIAEAGFKLDASESAACKIEQIGLNPSDVKHIILTHGDPDHAGGLADFPEATVHVAQEELDRINAGAVRYRSPQFAHKPRWQAHGPSSERWFGHEARRVNVGTEPLFLIPLFGHTYGHCGVALAQGDRWLLHVGDAYYLRVELETDDHPVSALAAARADDDAARRESLRFLKTLAREQADQVHMFGYHDFSEFPTAP